MFKSYKYLMPSYLPVISTIFLGTGCCISSVSAANYSVVAGSQVLLATINDELAPTNVQNGLIVANNMSMMSLPLMGGFSKQGGNCISQSDVMQIDGRNGIKINQAGIIAGFTGRISGGVVTIKKSDEQTVSETYSGGILIDNNGYITAEGNAEQSFADRFCATVTGPYPTGGANNRNNLMTAPNNTEWGNKLATAEGYLWIYVAKDIPLGTYSLNGLFLSQGPGFSNYASIDITQAGDTLTVVPPPCTINTETSINFDTSYPAGRIVSAPITYQCGDVESSTVLDAYLVATAVGSPASSTELALTSSGDNPGGVVRGYVGQGVDTDNVHCLDSANSLSFDGAFNSKLAPVSNGLALQIPLVWQLCLQGNEVPGRATGSVLLDIGYK